MEGAATADGSMQGRMESCPSIAALGGGLGGTVCHPSHTPGGCGHGVGVDVSQENRETKVRTIVVVSFVPYT